MAGSEDVESESERLLASDEDVAKVSSWLDQLSELDVKRILGYLLPGLFGIASATLFLPASKPEIYTASGEWLAKHLRISSPYLYFLSAAPDLFILAYFFGRNFTSVFRKAYNEASHLG